MSLVICLSFLVTFVLSLILVPIVSKITKQLGIIAHTNNRTIHKGVIARTGGYAIYASFLIGAMIFLKTDTQINAILLGGFVIFITGFYDDIHDLSPKYKMLGQLIAALIVIFVGGVSLKNFGISFFPDGINDFIAIIVTIGWIVGITNAVNLIDGLDGLCGGISIIVLVTISLTSLTYGRTDISSLSLLLAGAIGGFLVYNFHPASVFLGDCGALFIGFMIAVISLLGFGYKSSSFFTLGAPIIVLMVPIMDTIIAIVRRKVHHKKFSEADRNHLHHKLMFSLELGQTKSVLILYFVTILFSLCSYLYLFDKIAASILFVTLMLLFEVFVEATSMIGRKYKPLLTILNIFIKSEYLPSIKDTKPYHRIFKRSKKQYAIIGIVCITVICSLVYVKYQPKPTKVKTESIVYTVANKETQLMSDVYNQLTMAQKSHEKEDIGKYAGTYFLLDYYTLANKQKDEIGGLDYFYKDKQADFKKYALEDYYKDADVYIEKQEQLPEVTQYEILSYEKSHKALSGLEDYNYYDLTVELTFKENNPIIRSQSLVETVTLIEKQQRFSVVAVGE